MLSQPQFEAMIAWMPHGRAFRVLRPNDFEQQVMPIYFGHSRYSNFLSTVRQYGFKHFTQGPDKGCLYHEVSSSLVQIGGNLSLALSLLASWLRSHLTVFRALISAHASKSTPLGVSHTSRSFILLFWCHETLWNVAKEALTINRTLLLLS
jgi:hypothetical protein